MPVDDEPRDAWSADVEVGGSDVQTDTSEPRPGACELEDGTLVLCEPSPPSSFRASADCDRHAAGDEFDGDGVCQALHPQLPCGAGTRRSTFVLPAVPFGHGPGAMPPITWCEPIEAPRTCDAGSAPAYGSGACVPVGNACPDEGDAWPTNAAIRERAPRHRARIWFVAEGAAPGGDGTREAPFARISDAVDVAGAGHIIALGPGVWDEHVVLRRGVALVGACAERTILAPVGAAPAVEIRASVAHISDLTIRGAQAPVHVTSWASGTVLSGLDIDGGTAPALRIDGHSDVDLEGAWIRDAAAPRDDDLPACVDVSGGASLTAARLTVDRCPGVAVRASGSQSTVQLAQALVRGGHAAGAGGVGLLGEHRAHLELTATLVEGHERAGIAMSTGELDVDEVVIRDTHGGSDSVDVGTSVLLERTTRVSLHGLVLRDQDVALVALDTAGTVLLEDTVVLDTRVPTGGDAPAAVLLSGRHAALERVAVIDVAGTAVVARNAVGVRAQDLVLAHANDASDPTGGVGLAVRESASVRVSRMYAAGFPFAAVTVRDGGAHADLAWLTFVDNGWDGQRSGSSGAEHDASGGAVIVSDGSSADLQLALIERTTGAALSVLDGGQASLWDSLILGVSAMSPDHVAAAVAIAEGSELLLVRTIVRDVDGLGILARGAGADLRGVDVLVDLADASGAGRGIEVADAATARLSAVGIAGTTDVGLAILGDGSEARVDSLTVASVDGADCADEGDCAPTGLCIALAGDARGLIEGFRLAECALAGIYVSPAAQLDVSNGRIVDSPVGLLSDQPAPELAEWLDGIVFESVAEAARGGQGGAPEPTVAGDAR